jgi:hypothetical protein
VSETRDQRAFRWTMQVVGAVAVTAGTSGVLRGLAELRGSEVADVNADTEHRFYAAWYATIGAQMLRAARAPEQAGGVVTACAAGFALAAAGRLISWRRFGPPHALYRGLLALELPMPLLIPLHRRAFPRR